MFKSCMDYITKSYPPKKETFMSSGTVVESLPSIHNLSIPSLNSMMECRSKKNNNFVNGLLRQNAPKTEKLDSSNNNCKPHADQAILSKSTQI